MDNSTQSLSHGWVHPHDESSSEDKRSALSLGRISLSPFSKGAMGRIGAMMLRYWYMLRRSWTRILELIYWPAMSMVVWGLLQLYLSGNKGSLAGVAGLLLGGVLLWDILVRGQLGFTFSFLEEVWSRNLANLMMSLVRLLISTIPVTILAAVLFGFNIYALGFGIIAFFVNLVLLSWALGLFVSGLIMRNGLGAESLAYSMMIVLLPLSCVYYPVEVLPHWLQPLAWSLPTTYVFEGLRWILIDGIFRTDLMLEGLALNCVYLGLGFGSFIWLLQSARHNGSLHTIGE